MNENVDFSNVSFFNMHILLNLKKRIGRRQVFKLKSIRLKVNSLKFKLYYYFVHVCDIKYTHNYMYDSTYGFLYHQFAFVHLVILHCYSTRYRKEPFERWAVPQMCTKKQAVHCSPF